MEHGGDVDVPLSRDTNMLTFVLVYHVAIYRHFFILVFLRATPFLSGIFWSAWYIMTDQPVCHRMLPLNLNVGSYTFLDLR